MSSSLIDKDSIKIIKGLIEYSARHDLILEEIYTSRILPQLQNVENIEIVVEDLCEKFTKLPTFFHASEEQLRPIITELKFIDLLCNLLTPKSPDTVSKISQCFFQKFLQVVLEPTILKCFEEEQSNYTSYLQIICENVTHPSLVEKLFEFILTPKIITILLKRLRETSYANEKPIALIATLRLFLVLLDFYCEDFWYEVIISHLASQNHLIKYQRGVALPEIDIVESSARFLSLIPISVLNTMGPDLQTHYMEYSFQEVSHLSVKDTSILETAAKKFKESEKGIMNQHYPLWKYKYDGTDNYKDDDSEDDEEDDKNDCDNETVCTATTEEDLDDDRMISSSCDSNDQLTLVPPSGKDTPDSERDLLNIVLDNDDPKFNKSIKILISVDPQVATLDWDFDLNTNDNEILIVDDEKPSTSKDAILKMQQENNSKKIVAVATLGTFGPFLDCLFDLLQNWCILDMETLLVATEVISILASSRIPLVTSILLDTQLILQPSFPSFQRNLNTIRVHLEALLESYPQVLSDTWKMLLEHEQQPGRSLKTLIETTLLQNGRSNSNSSLVSTMSTDSRISVSSMMNNFGQRFRTSLPFRIAKDHIDKLRKANPDSSTGRIHSRSGVSQNSIERDENQLMADRKELETARLIGLRTLLFSQWLMELGAIAQQTCWSVPVRGV